MMYNVQKIQLRITMIFFFMGTVVAFAQHETLFEAGNDFYKNGKYQEAIEKYLEVSENGAHSSALYYNLANSYYKLNQIAPSIYYYEKALLLNPADEDVQNNLKYAKNMTIDAIDVMPQTGIDKLIENVIGKFSYSVWAILAIVFMVLFVLIFLLYYFSPYQVRKRIYFAISTLCLIFSLLSLGFAHNQYGIDKAYNPAIVFAKETSVMSEPNMRSEEVFLLHEGTKVNVINSLGEWKKIRLADGKIGWIPSSEIKEVKDI